MARQQVQVHVLTNECIYRSWLCVDHSGLSGTFKPGLKRASGHGGHNILTVVMNKKGADLDRALDWLAEYKGIVLSGFLARCRMLPSLGPDMYPVVTTFVEKLAY